MSERLTVSSLRPETNAELAALIQRVRERADAFVFLCGGASGMSDATQHQLKTMFHAIADLARSGRRLAVGDGGTDAGIMRAAGEARHASGNAFLLIGVAPAQEIPPRGSTPLDPNHSHIVSVDNPAVIDDGQEAWGSETETMYWLFDRFAEGRPSVAVVANGGGIVLTEVAANVEAGRRIILIEGSGRAADALVSSIRNAAPTTDEIRDLRDRAEATGLTERPGLFRVVSLGDGAAGLHAELVRALDREH